MKYYITRRKDGMKREITKEEAREYLKSNYIEGVSTFSEMLETENIYPCMFSILEVTKGQ